MDNTPARKEIINLTKIDSQTLLKSLKAWEASQADQIRSVSQIVRLSGNKLRLSEISRQSTDAKLGLAIYLAEQIARLSMFYNLGKQINEAQATETAMLIIESFGPRLVLADCILFFRKFKTGQYGKLFDRLDGGVIIDALNQYLEEKMTEIERKNYEEHQSTKIVPGREFAEWSEETRMQMSEHFKKIAEKYESKLQEQKGKRLTFNSIEAWCASEFIDPDLYMKDFEQEIRLRFEEFKKDGLQLDLQRFTQWQYARKLAEINKEIIQKI